MLDAETQTRLQDILRRESRSFLQYIRDSFPWTTSDETKALAMVQALIEEERSDIAAFAKFLVRHRIALPYLGPYPVAYTTQNFVSLDHLLPMLVSSQRQAIANLEEDRTPFMDPDSRQEIQKLLDMKRQHLKTLEALATAHPETAVR